MDYSGPLNKRPPGDGWLEPGGDGLLGPQKTGQKCDSVVQFFIQFYIDFIQLFIDVIQFLSFYIILILQFYRKHFFI